MLHTDAAVALAMYKERAARMRADAEAYRQAKAAATADTKSRRQKGK